MKIILALALVLALIAVLGLCAWGTATATTNLVLAGGIAFNQLTIMLLVIGLLVLVGVMIFVGLQTFHLGRAVERSRARDDLAEAQRALDQSRTHVPQLIEPMIMIAPSRPYDQIDPPAPRRAVRRIPRVRRAALRVAKRWFQ